MPPVPSSLCYALQKLLAAIRAGFAMRLLITVVIGAISVSHVSAQSPDSLILQLDNDEFAGLNKRDRWYSSGARILAIRDGSSPLAGDSAAAHWAWKVRRTCPAAAHAAAQPGTSHVSIGQNIYTQDVRDRAVPVANDRPIAAYLYATLGNRLQTQAGDVSLSAELGVTGPAALGEPIQNGLHSVLRVDRVPAWSYQVRPRLGLNLHFGCLGRSRFDFGSLLTQYSVSVGTTMAQASIAGALAFGPGRATAVMPADARLIIPGSHPGKFWSAVIGLRVNWVGYDALLDGDTYRYQSGVNSRQLTAQFFAGISFNIWKNWRLEYVFTQRSHDFDGPGVAAANYEAQQTGTLSLRIPLQ
ncbi:MAG: lipid A deacylase LpxR family protein [Burkholderiaceae bacterium]